MASKHSKGTLIHLQLTFFAFKLLAILNLTRARTSTVTEKYTQRSLSFHSTPSC